MSNWPSFTLTRRNSRWRIRRFRNTANEPRARPNSTFRYLRGSFRKRGETWRARERVTNAPCGTWRGAGQNAGAAGALQSLAMISLLTGEGLASDLAFARQQKLSGWENRAIAALQAAQGDTAGSERSLQLYAAARPELGPQGIEQIRNYNALYAALVRKDPQGVIAAAGRLPNFIDSLLRYPRGWAYFETKDYSRAEQDLRAAVLDEKLLSNFNAMRTRSPLLAATGALLSGPGL